MSRKYGRAATSQKYNYVAIGRLAPRPAGCRSPAVTMTHFEPLIAWSIARGFIGDGALLVPLVGCFLFAPNLYSLAVHGTTDLL